MKEVNENKKYVYSKKKRKKLEKTGKLKNSCRDHVSS